MNIAPPKDARDVLRVHGPEALRGLVAHASPFILESSRQVAMASGGEAVSSTRMKSATELMAMADTRRFDVRIEQARPLPVFSIAGRTISTPGNLTNVQALAKAGKSAVVSAITAAAFNGARREIDTFGFIADNVHGHALIHFDTEQSRYDHDQLIRRALARAAVDVPPPWFESYWMTDLDMSDRRCALRHLVERASIGHGGVFAIIIDGVADLVSSVNDEELARGLVAELHKLAIDFDCAVVTVLHENPGSTIGKTRGHLGSELERKAETNLRLEKDKDEVTTIWSDRARHCAFPKSAGVCFQWSDAVGMHATRGTAGEIKSEQKHEQHRAEAVECCQEGVPLGRNALRDIVMDKLGYKSDKTANDRIKAWYHADILTKTAGGKYLLVEQG